MLNANQLIIINCVRVLPCVAQFYLILLWSERMGIMAMTGNYAVEIVRYRIWRACLFPGFGELSEYVARHLFE